MTDISGDETPGPQAAKILLVEDSFANRDMLTRRLTRRGYMVCSAADGASGVAMSVSEQPDLILMDVALGEMDGWQATQLIKADARTQAIPIIALTAHALASDRDKSIEVGCADFDTKPVDLSRLLDKIEGCLAKTDPSAGFSHRNHPARQEHTEGVNTMLKLDPVAALTGSARDFRELQGTDLMARVSPFHEWQELRRQSNLWPYSRTTQEAPLSVCTALDESGVKFTGLNFGTQDYLGLSSHPAIKEEAKAVIDEYGVHSAGATVLAGNTKYSLRLEQTISEFLKLEHTTLYPTGWAAGYGVIKALIRPADHVVMDGLSHACLQEGAYSATANVYLHGHLSLDSARRLLKRIRAKDTVNGILVVTESLFSMDSDTPDLRAMQSLCDEYDATLLVDVAHDLGAMGPGGRGFIGTQDMLGKVDIVMGSFSKSFGSNGGFVSSNSPAVRQYLKYYGCTATFSNALSPVQAATVTKAFDIIKSEEGLRLRTVLRQRIEEMREALTHAGLQHMGNPSPIIPVRVGDEALARLVSRRLPALEIIANLVEYPAVAKGDARLRLQMMPTHSLENVRTLAARLRTAIDHAQIEHVRHRAAIADVTRSVATDTEAAEAA